MSKIPVFIASSALLTVMAFAQSLNDRDVLAKIRTEGLEHSQVAPVFETLTIEIGPRLTASPAHKRAAEWARDRLTSYGLANVHLEPWKFGRGWTQDKLTIEMAEPRYLPLIGYADGWSASTSGEIVAMPVFIGGKSVEEVETMKGQLRGAIVMSQPMMSSFVRRDRPNPSDESYQPNTAAYATSVGRGNASASGRGAQQAAAQRGLQLLRDAGAGVILRPSSRDNGRVLGTGRNGGPAAVPSLTISGEHYNMMARMLEKHVPVKLRVHVQTKFFDADKGNTYNVIAELPGTDPVLRDEVVM